MTRAELVEILEAAGATRPSERVPVWDLVEPGLLSRGGHGRSHRARLGVIDYMRARSCPLFLYIYSTIYFINSRLCCCCC